MGVKKYLKYTCKFILCILVMAICIMVMPLKNSKANVLSEENTIKEYWELKIDIETGDKYLLEVYSNQKIGASFGFADGSFDMYEYR